MLEKESEMLSAIIAAIWVEVGFLVLKFSDFSRGVEYAYIFYITTALYVWNLNVYFKLLIMKRRIFNSKSFFSF